MSETNDRQENFRHRIGKWNAVSVAGTESSVTPQTVIEREVAAMHPGIPSEEMSRIAREIILNDSAAAAKIGPQAENYDRYTVKLAESIENNSSERYLRQNLERRPAGPVAEDASVGIADTIEAINAGIAPRAEYFLWIEEGAEVIKCMNDGFVSAEDLDMRNNLLTQFGQREIELMVCLNLYRSSPALTANPAVQEKYREMSQKLYKLREIRSAILTTTKNHKDEKVTEQEYKTALPFWLVMQEILQARRNKEHERESRAREKFRLALNSSGGLREADRMALRLPPYDRTDAFLLQELAVLGMMAQNRLLSDRPASRAEYLLAHRGKEDTREKNHEKIDRLRGLSVEGRVLTEKYRAQLREKQFYKNNFNMLQNTAVHSIN
jgi:hypothetical protein